MGNIKDLIRFVATARRLKRIGTYTYYKDYIGEVLFDFGGGDIFSIYGWYGGDCLGESYVSWKWLDKEELHDAFLGTNWHNLPG